MPPKKHAAPAPPPPRAGPAGEEGPKNWWETLSPEEQELELKKQEERAKKAKEHERQNVVNSWKKAEAEKERQKQDRQHTKKVKEDEEYNRKIRARALKEQVVEGADWGDGVYWAQLPNQTWREVADIFWCVPCEASLNYSVLESHLDGEKHRKRTGQGASPSCCPGASSSPGPVKQPDQDWLVWLTEESFGPGFFLRCLLCGKWVQDVTYGEDLDSYCGTHGKAGTANQKDHARKIQNLSGCRSHILQERTKLGVAAPAPTSRPAPPPKAPAQPSSSSGPADAAPKRGGGAPPPHPPAPQAGGGGYPGQLGGRASPPQPWLAWVPHDDGEMWLRCLLCSKMVNDYDEVNDLKDYNGSHGFPSNNNQKDHARKLPWYDREYGAAVLKEKVKYHPEVAQASRPKPAAPKPKAEPAPESNGKGKPPPQPWLAWVDNGGDLCLKCLLCDKWLTDADEETDLQFYQGMHGYPGLSAQPSKDHHAKHSKWGLYRGDVERERRKYHPGDPTGQPTFRAAGPAPASASSKGGSKGSGKAGGAAWGKAPGGAGGAGGGGKPSNPFGAFTGGQSDDDDDGEGGEKKNHDDESDASSIGEC